MIIADTNVLLRAALDDDPAQSREARRCLAEADGIAVPIQVLCEFVWVASRSYRLKSRDIASSVLLLLNDGKVHCDREAALAGLEFMIAGGDFADGIIEFEGRARGGDLFATFDRQAAEIVAGKGRGCILLAPD
ncbi:type II toxin-antitoxin system VapC family toxin [Rhizobium sp. TRM95111]|uniref:type II toxin-antitoxin system VapC family toxin n=1 Tax=Rhizobium alarense TaxID=2846851 RepID=UPI001F474024|nr:type II toxin-antitoxin system VapC family toxin [Rhizobium alarense]MCF3640718.1 type II toxin-antitoxin system VapC family toxin [Rhizobium alarense]